MEPADYVSILIIYTKISEDMSQERRGEERRSYWVEGFSQATVRAAASDRHPFTPFLREKEREQNKQNRALKTLGNSGCCKRKKKKKRPVWHAFGKNLSSMGSSISVHNSSVEVTEDGFSMLLLLCQITCGQHDPCSYCWYRIFMSRFLR